MLALGDKIINPILVYRIVHIEIKLIILKANQVIAFVVVYLFVELYIYALGSLAAKLRVNPTGNVFY